MAELEEGETGDIDAVRSWLVRAASAAPDPAWICADCGAAHINWTPLCSRCDALGALGWRIPQHATALPKPEMAALPAEDMGETVAEEVSDDVLIQELLPPDSSELTLPPEDNPSAVNQSR